MGCVGWVSSSLVVHVEKEKKEKKFEFVKKKQKIKIKGDSDFKKGVNGEPNGCEVIIKKAFQSSTKIQQTEKEKKRERVPDIKKKKNVFFEKEKRG